MQNRKMKLIIHRWFGGSAHPKVLFVKGKQWNYPRLANYAVPMMAGAIITGGHLIFVVGFSLVVPLFLYTALNPLSLEEWWVCYLYYWERKGYMIEALTDGTWEIVTPNKRVGAVDFENAISVMYFDIYNKWPMRV